MTDVNATIILVVLLIILIVLVASRSYRASFLIVMIMIVIPIIGHTDWNRQYQLTHAIQNLHSTGSINVFSDVDAEKDIVSMKHPLQIRILSSQEDSQDTKTNKIYNTTVDINQNQYAIRIVCYMTPLTWTPFETWKINQINKVK